MLTIRFLVVSFALTFYVNVCLGEGTVAVQKGGGTGTTVMIYPEVSLRQIQEVSGDSLLVADTLKNTVPARWILQASPYYQDTVTIVAQCVVPANVLTYTQAGFTMLLRDTTTNWEPWGGILVRVGNTVDTAQAIVDGFLNVKRGDIIRMTGRVDEFPAGNMNSLTMLVPIPGVQIDVIDSSSIPGPINRNTGDFYTGVFPGGSVRYSSGEAYEGVLVNIAIPLTVDARVNAGRGTFSAVDGFGNQIADYDASRFFTLGHGGSLSFPGDSTWAVEYPAVGSWIDTLRGMITTVSGSESPRGYRVAPVYRGDAHIGDEISFVTIESNPAGRYVVVDDTSYMTSAVFSWATGSTHTISADSIQYDSTGAVIPTIVFPKKAEKPRNLDLYEILPPELKDEKFIRIIDPFNGDAREVYKYEEPEPNSPTVVGETRYLWQSWNNGGERTQTVTVSADTILSADFGTQHYLAMGRKGAAGTVTFTPKSGWYNKDSTMAIHAGESFAFIYFTHWVGTGTGAYSGTDNPALITLQSAIAESAYFAGCTYAILEDSLFIGEEGGEVSFTLETQPTCGFSLMLVDPWIDFASMAGDSGTYLITLSVDPLGSNPDRAGKVRIVGIVNTLASTWVIQRRKVGWEAAVKLTDDCMATQILVFGQSPFASDGIDIGLGEYELPPLPPAPGFDSRFVLPTIPVSASPVDIRNDSLGVIDWAMTFQGCIPTPFTIRWKPDSLPPGSVRLRDGLGGMLVDVDMKAESTYTLNQSLSSLLIEYRKDVWVQVPVTNGWNMISVPVQAASMHVDSLFPGHTSLAFSYDGAYVSDTILSVGRGYWLRFNATDTFSICGQTIRPPDISVNTGWNMIGPYDFSAPVSEITSAPPGIISSSFFWFSGGYVVESTLEPGSGYWQKSTQAGVLHLNSATSMPKMASQNYGTGSSVEFVFVDSVGNETRLFLVDDPQSQYLGELPPFPPTGTFEARFSTNSMAELAGANKHFVELQNVVFPLTVTGCNMGTERFIIRDEITGNLLNEEIIEGRNVTVRLPLTTLIIEVVEQSEANIPTTYILYQNYPNPFNPTTVLKYGLPHDADVRLTVYNVLGQALEEPVNGKQAAGYHEVQFDASTYSSGLYLYRLEASGFSNTKKMLLMK